MPEMVRDAGLGALTGLAGRARRRRGRPPPWLRLVVVFGVATALWAAIIFGLYLLLKA